jgi:hypothetical protein
MAMAAPTASRSSAQGAQPGCRVVSFLQSSGFAQPQWHKNIENHFPNYIEPHSPSPTNAAACGEQRETGLLIFGHLVIQREKTTWERTQILRPTKAPRENVLQQSGWDIALIRPHLCFGILN